MRAWSKERIEQANALVADSVVQMGTPEGVLLGMIFGMLTELVLVARPELLDAVPTAEQNPKPVRGPDGKN